MKFDIVLAPVLIGEITDAGSMHQSRCPIKDMNILSVWTPYSLFIRCSTGFHVIGLHNRPNRQSRGVILTASHKHTWPEKCTGPG
jgi:hypothetical protein